MAREPDDFSTFTAKQSLTVAPMLHWQLLLFKPNGLAEMSAFYRRTYVLALLFFTAGWKPALHLVDFDGVLVFRHHDIPAGFFD